jgi:muconolactone delta-isomerase
MHNKMQSAYDESFSPDEAFDAAYAEATKEEQYILRQLKNDGMLGFDYPHQAIKAIIEEPTAFDLAPQLKTAISKMGNKFVEDPTAGVSQIPLDAQFDDQVTNTPIPAPAPGSTVVPAPGQPYTLPKLTKLQPAPTAGQQVKNVTQKITNAWNDDGFWTRFRIAAVDPTAGLAKTLSSLPLFQNGQLRADMLIRSFNQVINLIKNGIQSGIPVVNADGTVIIQQDANNLARSQVIADGLDNNPIVKGSGFSGRGYIGEIARIKRGEEIMAEDARLRAKGALMMAEAKAKMAQAKQLRAGNAAMGDIIKLVNQAKALRREGTKIKDINREKQVTQAHIDWADAQIKAVPETKEVFDIWRATNMGLIDLWESAGLLTAAEAANYRQKTSYVPLYAAREDLAFDQQEAYTGKGTGTKSVRLLDRLEGSDLQRNIWENMDKHYASMTAAAFQNQTRRVAVEQLQTVGAAKISTTDDNPAVNLRYKDPSHPNANQHGVVSVILDNPNDLAAFQMMHYELGPLMKGLSATTQALRATALINPMYWIRQLIRDPIHASIVAGTGIVTPFHSAKEYINILANNSEEALLLARRGVIGQIDSTMDLADFLKQVGTEKLNPSKLDALIHKVMRMHEASDAATRVAIYKKAKAEGLARGMSEKEATDYGVFKSRESINFAVRGNSKTLNALRHMIPFFSAAITGLDTLYRAASGYGLNPAEKKAAQQLFIKRAGMMAMLSVAYAMILQDDEDYQKLPDNVKDNNWLLPNPFGGGHSFLKISIPYEVGFLFKTIPEASVRYMAGTSTGKEVLASYFGGLKRNLPGEGVLIPQAAKPALEAITNYSFFTGRGIEGMSDQGLPVAQRGPNASEVAKTLSKAGLDKVGISPAKFDHLMQGYFAELGTFSTGMAGAAIAAATGKEPPAKNIEQMPFFKAFMTNPNTSKAATDFYEIMGAAQETVNAVNRMKKEGRIQEAKEFLSDEDTRKLAAVAPAMRKVQDNMAKIRARINQIQASKGMDPETKRVQINKLMEMYDKTARQGYMITQKAGIQR